MRRRQSELSPMSNSRRYDVRYDGTLQCSFCVFIVMFIWILIMMFIWILIVMFMSFFVTKVHLKMSGPFKMVSCVFPVPVAVQGYMTKPQESIVFKFFDPTEILVRLLMFSPVAGHNDNLALFPENNEILHGFATAIG